MSILIDIGAMNGKEIIWALKEGYEVHAFEPNPNMKEKLKPYENIATINYAAAWNKDGTAPLYRMATSEPGEDGVSLIKEKTNVGKENFVEVPTINIGLYLKKLNKDIDILKINAEGAEYIIIESILEHFDYKRINRWLVEDHANYIKSEEWEKHKNKVLAHLSYLDIKLENWNGV